MCRGVAEDGGHLSPHQLEDEAFVLRLWQGGELGGKGPRGGAAALGDADQAAEDRRQRAGGGQRPEAGGVDRDRQGLGAIGAKRRDEEGQAPLVGERLDAAAPHPRQLSLDEPCGHAALALQKAPSDRSSGETLCFALLGEGVEEDVGGGVVGLTGAAEGACHGGEENEGGEIEVLGQLVQVPGGICLGGEDPLELLLSQGLDRGVGERSGAVDHRAQGMLGGDRGQELLESLAIRHITGGDLCLRPQLFEPACSSLAPCASGPLLLTKSRWRAPWCSARWRAVSAPRPPVAPLIRTVRAGSIARGPLSTTLPTFLPSRRWRKARGALP